MTRVSAVLVFALILGAVLHPVARAQAASPPSIPDPRIRTLFYDPDKVVRLDGYVGYQLMLQFGPGERVENVAIGEGSTWQVIPNKEASLLFVKPMAKAIHTNMTVVTDRHEYLFELTAHQPAGAAPLGIPYVIRFIYPPPPVAVTFAPPPKPQPPERRNTAYAYTGDQELVPSLVFDDGRFTYFQWRPNAVTPAVFVVGLDGKESLAEYSHHDGFQVVEQLAPRFRLRDGSKVTTVINETWRPPSPGAEAPRPFDAKTARARARRGEPR
jgi:type IV secretion system protein VirB9